MKLGASPALVAPPANVGHTLITSSTTAAVVPSLLSSRKTIQPVSQSSLHVEPSELPQTVTGARRLIASLRANCIAVTNPLVALVRRLFWRAAWKLGTASVKKIAKTTMAIMISRIVNPDWFRKVIGQNRRAERSRFKLSGDSSICEPWQINAGPSPMNGENKVESPEFWWRRPVGSRSIKAPDSRAQKRPGCPGLSQITSMNGIQSIDAGLLAVALLELVDATAGIDQLVLSSVEGVRLAGHLNFHERIFIPVFPFDGLLGLDGRARLEDQVAGQVLEDHVAVVWMDIGLHGSISYEIFEFSRALSLKLSAGASKRSRIIRLVTCRMA